MVWAFLSFVSFGSNLAQSARPVRSVGRWAEMRGAGGVCSEACVLSAYCQVQDRLSRRRRGQSDPQNCSLRGGLGRRIAGCLREWKCGGLRKIEQQGQEDVSQWPGPALGTRDSDFYWLPLDAE